MSKIAIIQFAGKQYQVAEGDVIAVDRQVDETGASITIPSVLLVIEGEKTIVGQPTVAKASVKAEVVAHELGDKIRVSTYKAKSRYHKTKGYRHQLTN